MDPERDLHAQGMEGNVYRTRYMGSTVCEVLCLNMFIFMIRVSTFRYMSLFLPWFTIS